MDKDDRKIYFQQTKPQRPNVRPEAGLLQKHPAETHPLYPERVPEQINYAPNPIKTQPFSQGLASYKSTL